MKTGYYDVKFIFFIFPLLFIVSACFQRKTGHIEKIAVTSIVSIFTLAPVSFTPSPLPTHSNVFVITPNANQVEIWKEYQTELAQNLLSFLPPEQVFCEWDILGSNENTTFYAWVVCESITEFSSTISGKNIYFSSSQPVVINTENNGKIQNIIVPTTGASDYPILFPQEIIVKFDLYRFGKVKIMSEHIADRRLNPNIPPLIILSVVN